MNAWYVPSFHGDLRLEPDEEDPKHTRLSIVDPTPAEQKQLIALSAILVDREWLEEAIPDAMRAVTIRAPLEEVGPVFVNALKPGPAVLTAVRFHDGQVEVVEHRPTGKTGKELAKIAKRPKAEAAVTVKRPTPSCPECVLGSVAPASDVLLAFLTPEQHRTWAKRRYIVTRGGITGHRYILAHRESEIAALNGRIAWDADDKDILHFHDQTVPPEEEVLAAKLILEHREPWLRNDATCLGPRFTKHVFLNPFGTWKDGVEDATFTKAVGAMAAVVLG